MPVVVRIDRAVNVDDQRVSGTGIDINIDMID